MSLVIKRLRQILIFILGILVLIIGVILIPLPGPGLLVMLLGFMILSTEFTWAKRHTDRLKAHFKQAFDKIKEAAKSPDSAGPGPKK